MFGSSILAMDFTVTLMVAALALLVVILVVSAILDRGDSAQDRRDLEEIRRTRPPRAKRDDGETRRAA
jgi:hypothetical protein